MKPKDFNINNLEIPDLKLNDLHLHGLMGLALEGVVNNIDDYKNSISTKTNQKYYNFEAMSDLEKPLTNQTEQEFKKMLKFLNEVEDLFINFITGFELSEKEAIKQWIIFVNIINIDEESRFLRVVKYRDLNEKYINKLVKHNPQFANKIENINKFGFDAKNEKELQEKLSASYKVANSGCMLSILFLFILTLLI